MVDKSDPSNSLTQQIAALENQLEPASTAAHGSLEDQIAALEAEIGGEAEPGEATPEPQLEPQAVTDSPAMPSGKAAGLR